MTRDEVQEQFGAAPDDGGPSDRMADEIVRLRKEYEIVTSMLYEQVPLLNQLQDEADHARALLIDLKRLRDEAERSRPIIQAAQAYLDSGGNYTSWLALRQLLPLSPSSPYATPT